MKLTPFWFRFVSVVALHTVCHGAIYCMLAEIKIFGDLKPSIRNSATQGCVYQCIWTPRICCFWGFFVLLFSNHTLLKWYTFVKDKRTKNMLHSSHLWCHMTRSHIFLQGHIPGQYITISQRCTPCKPATSHLIGSTNSDELYHGLDIKLRKTWNSFKYNY